MGPAGSPKWGGVGGGGSSGKHAPSNHYAVHLKPTQSDSEGAL